VPAGEPVSVEDAELVLEQFDGLYQWHAPKPGLSLIGTHLGRAMVTSRRFLFLSTGTSGVGKALLMGLAGGPLLSLTLGRTRTDELDLSALANPGSLVVPLDHVVASRVGRRWDFSNFFAVETAGTGGLPRHCAYMTKFGRARDELAALQAALEKARAELMSSPYRR
jgi:hypothetical protein